MNDPILPGSTIGILGGGQLGRMLALVAKRIGYRVVIFSDVPNSPAEQVSDHAIVGEYTNEDLLTSFKEECDVITYEFENIPFEACVFLQKHCLVRPHPDAIYHSQHRARERALLTELGVPVARYHRVVDENSIDELPEDFPFPAILKTASFGYDGKGQVLVASRSDLLQGFETLKRSECILEEKIPFTKEFSIVVARNGSGEFVTYGPIENHHENHILDISSCPGDIPVESGDRAARYGKAIAEKLQVQGVVTVECFLTSDGGVVANEIAPRPHNSGHLTIEGFATSQFEQQLRGICSLPLGSAKQVSPVVMVNLLGDLWGSDQKLAAAPVFSEALTYLHLYGKEEARPGRKMGHLTVLSKSVDQAREQALSLREKISSSTSRT